MASVNYRKRGNRWLVYWRLDDGSQGGHTVATKEAALDLVAAKRMAIKRGTVTAQRKGRRPFARWDADWWEVWSAEPGRSPTTLAATEIRRRRHVLPHLGARPVERITPQVLRQWQNQLADQVGYQSVMACRSIVFRVLQFAEDEGAIPTNPMRKVPAPRPPVDPDEIFGEAKRRSLTPQEAGRLLGCFPPAWWDHVLCLLGTGLRFGELAGLRRRRVHLDRPLPVLQVVDTRYQAGRFGSGFRNRPKSPAGFREIPLASLVAEAIRRRLPADATADMLVFTGPGGGYHVRRGARTVLSRDNFHRTFEGAVAKLTDPTATLRPTAKRVLRSLRAAGPATAAELTARLAAHGRALKVASIQAALAELATAGVATGDSDPAGRWTPVEVERTSEFGHLALRGTHDFRHTFATWLEDAGVPARVIDELMGHEHGNRARHAAGSRIGQRYRETTLEMRARVVAAVEERLAIVLKTATEQHAG